MSDSNSITCPNCSKEMEAIELKNVPVENLKDFLSTDGNKLEDNWYWCPGCDCFDQASTPKKLSPEAEYLEKMLEYYPGF